MIDHRVEIVAAILRQHRRVLLCHRTPQRENYPNLWGFPGGHVEAGEEAGQALVRELAEELGITIARPSLPPTAGFATDQIRMRVWLVESWAGVPTNVAPDEHDDLLWADLDQVGRLDLAHSEHYYPILTRLLS